MPATTSVTIRTLFAPFDDTQGEYLAFVSQARRSIYIVIYGFHLPRLTDLLIARYQAGVQIGIILDHSQAEGRAEASEVQRLLQARVPLLIGTSPVHRQILHSKFTVVDEEAVECGSWNYSLSASQQSNTLTIVHNPAYAAPFLQHYDRLRAFILLHELSLQPAGAVPAPATANPGTPS
jgi:phosphatidylserine/phosphatidylglycerophosphate/cardiolipin synthase-like enzyme